MVLCHTLRVWTEVLFSAGEARDPREILMWCLCVKLGEMGQFSERNAGRAAGSL
jgi:hypothetical protein